MTLFCVIHGECEHKLRDKESRWRCAKCCCDAVKKRRQKVKAVLIAEHGGKCVDCGYEGPPFMFDFDHRNPSEKAFTVSARGSISLVRLRAEASKCDLVCANCHRMRTHKQRCSGCVHCC